MSNLNVEAPTRSQLQAAAPALLGTVRVTDSGPILMSIINSIQDTILDVQNRGNHRITESMHESAPEGDSCIDSDYCPSILCPTSTMLNK